MTNKASCSTYFTVTATKELDLKQRLAQLSERDRHIMSAFLIKIKHLTKRGKREISKQMKDMDAGKKNRLSTLADKLGHE